MIWFLLSIASAFGISLIIFDWKYMTQILPVGILSATGGIILFITLWTGYRYHIKSINFNVHTNFYAFYKSVQDYVEWYDSDHAPRFIKEQKRLLDELEKYIEINGKKIPSKILKRVNYLKDRLNKIVSNLWANAQHSDQFKRYEVWKDIKFNEMKNEIKPLYEQLKNDLRE